MVAGERAAATLTELHARLEPCFARPGPFTQARKYVSALMSDLPRKNGWTVAEHAGDATPDRTQRLLNHAVWDTMPCGTPSRPPVSSAGSSCNTWLPARS